MVHDMPLGPSIEADDMLRRMFERTGCHLAREPGALDKLVTLEQMTAEQHEEYAKDLRIPFDEADAKVRAAFDHYARTVYYIKCNECIM